MYGFFGNYFKTMLKNGIRNTLLKCAKVQQFQGEKSQKVIITPRPYLNANYLIRSANLV